MPMTISTEGIGELGAMLARLGDKAQDVASGALFDGAGVVADAYTAAINSIQTAPFKYARNGEKRLPSPEEKAALVKAVKGLGYHSTAEWMREMYRQTLKQYAALKLDGKTLHDLIPPIVEPVAPATKQS